MSQEPVTRNKGSETSHQEPENQLPGIRNRKPGIMSQEPVTRNQKPENSHQEPETSIKESGTGNQQS
jgi:hypothetical protein